MTLRNRFHSRIVIRVGQVLANWMDRQPEPRGEVVGWDRCVAVVSAELVAATNPDQKLYGGPRLLAVEILSPNDTHEDTAAMVTSYLDAGSVAWVIDPDLRTITVYRPTGKVETLSQRIGPRPSKVPEDRKSVV